MGWRSGQSYSQDLRDRVIGAVDGGMAVRQAAATFGVSIAYIYKALIRRRLTGRQRSQPEPGPPGPQAHAGPGDGAGGAHPVATWYHARTGPGLAAGRTRRVAQHRRDLERGAAARLVVQKKPCARPSKTGPTSRRAASCGGRPSPSSIRIASSSSTKQASPPRWRAFMAGRRSASAAGIACPSVTGKP